MPTDVGRLPEETATSFDAFDGNSEDSSEPRSEFVE